MRKLFNILLAAVVFLAIRGYCSNDSHSATLAFHVLSDDKIEGGRFIDTVDLPKLGYISSQPDLVITQLVAVSKTSARTQISNIGKDGKEVDGPWHDPELVMDFCVPFLVLFTRY